MAVPSRRFERALHHGWKESFATFGLRKRTAQPRVLPRIRAVYRVEQLLSCKVCSHYPPRSPLVEQQGPRDSAFDLSRFLLEGPLETALPAPFDDHQQPRSSDYLRLEHRANFIPIESGASRSVYFFSFLFFSSLFLSLSFFSPFFPSLLPLIRSRDTRRSFLVTRPRVLRVHRLRESRSAIRMKAFLKAVSYLCRCPHYGATCREHSSSSSACRGPNNDAPLWT